MSESKHLKVKLSAAERIAKERQLRDQERLQQIRYDDNLVKVENQVLKYELKAMKAERMRAQLIQRLTKSKSLSNKAMAHSLVQSSDPFQMEGAVSPSHSLFHRSTQASPMEAGQFESLPMIKRKGTSHHRRFVNEVRPRDYGLYLDSLNTLKDYRHAEYENKHIKNKLFKEKYRQQMGEYRMLSEAAWTKMTELNNRSTPKFSTEQKPAEKKGEKQQEGKPGDKKPADAKTADKKPAETKPADKKTTETKPGETKPEPKKDDLAGEF